MVDLDAIRARAEAAISALSDGKSACAECPDYGEPNGCNRHGGPCDAYDVCQDAAEVVETLLAEVKRLQGMLDNLRSVAENNGIEALREEIKRLKARRELRF